MALGLGKLLEAVAAQANPLDGGRSWGDVYREDEKPQPAVQPVYMPSDSIPQLNVRNMPSTTNKNRFAQGENLYQDGVPYYAPNPSSRTKYLAPSLYLANPLYENYPTFQPLKPMRSRDDRFVR